MNAVDSINKIAGERLALYRRIETLSRELNETKVQLNVALDQRDALQFACEQVVALGTPETIATLDGVELEAWNQLLRALGKSND